LKQIDLLLDELIEAVRIADTAVTPAGYIQQTKSRILARIDALVGKYSDGTRN
jgi:hypothetical protein